MRDVSVALEYQGVNLTVSASYYPAQNGGMTDPSFDAGFEDVVVSVGDQCINDLLTDTALDEITVAAFNKYTDDRDSDRADYEYDKQKEELSYGW